MPKTPAKSRTNQPAPDTAEEAGRALQEQHKTELQRFEEERAQERAQDEDPGIPGQHAASILLEPPVPPDNPKNPRGVSSNLTDGTPDAQATNAQKVQNPTPSRPPLSATSTTSVLERVSAGQNRKPPAEVIP